MSNEIKEGWKLWGNLILVVANVVVGALVLNVREVIRGELKAYVTHAEFVASWKAHADWAEAELGKQKLQFTDIQRQLEESKTDKRRMEDKIDRLLERVK